MSIPQKELERRLREISSEKAVKEAKSAYQRGEYLQSALLFETACRSFRESGDELDAAEMANNVSVAYLQADKPELALEAVRGTAEIFARAGDLRREGMALGNQASALEALHNDDEAATLYQRSADVLALAGEDQLRAAVMQSLSMLQLKMGRQLQALATMQAGLESVKHPTPKQSLTKKLLRIPIEMATKKKTS